MDIRVQQLAEIIVNHSVKVTKGSKVIISASDFTSLDLVKECYRLSLLKGAFVYLDLLGINYEIGRADSGGLYELFLENAAEEVLSTPPELMAHKIDWADKFIRITSINNRNFLSQVDKSRLRLWNSSYYKVFEKMIEKEWLLTYWPTIGTAQNANMSLEKFTDFYFEASIIDYERQGLEIKKLADILDKAKEIAIYGNGIDIKLGVEGRLFAGAISGTHNIPDGECFTGPQEDKTSGYIKFDYPQIYNGNQIEDIELEFKDGEIIKYNASKNKEFLDSVFNEDGGNKRLGELGIGMNKGIKEYIKDILFDEKIYGTVHFAVGSSYKEERGGGKNNGSIHWDMIKDLRHSGSSIKVDGEVIFKDGDFINL